MSKAIDRRYDFVYFFDVQNGNPNGDPDAGNMPRIDPETSHGLVTDVCLKRKIRNYVDMAKKNQPPHEIYVREKEVLNNQNKKAYINNPDIVLQSKKLPKEKAEAEKITRWMCDNFFDVRTFGAVMTTEVNCGQVRGPVQINFARSIDPIIPLEVSITRMAVTNEKDLEKERTMGRKHIVPYALYRAEGHISAHLAAKTGFSEADLDMLWESLTNMFEHDRSAARGLMSARRLIVFGHESALGNAPAHELFDAVKAKLKDESKPARAYGDYHITADEKHLPKGVRMEDKI